MQRFVTFVYYIARGASSYYYYYVSSEKGVREKKRKKDFFFFFFFFFRGAVCALSRNAAKVSRTSCAIHAQGEEGDPGS